MLKTGVFLAKRYEIIERIGSGGMADVYKSKDHKLNRFVAVKVLKSDYRTDKVFIQKFLSEAQAAAGLMHPNVVNVYDVGQDRGLYFMVMELVEGITLKDYIEKKDRLSAKETISIAIQMVTGIQAAHDHHIIHRDIKPQNIIISKTGKVKVTDFGIARATTSTATISTNVMGSVHYTSPEHAKGGIVDEKSDIYSAGITIYEMVTGHVPFDGDTTVEVAVKHLQEEVIPPSREVPDIPRSLENIIMKCIRKDPSERYQNCQELITDLKHSLVDPDGGFVTSSSNGMSRRDSTVVMSEEELERVQRRASNRNKQAERKSEGRNDRPVRNGQRESSDNNRNNPRKTKVDPNTQNIMKILMIVAAILIAFAVLFMAGKTAGLFKSTPGSTTTKEEVQVTVPNLIGMTEKEAQDALGKKNLGYIVDDRQPSDKYEKGTIMSQVTAANKKVAKNTEIHVIVSTGKKVETVSVPDVKGMDESAAQKALEGKGLIVDPQYTYDDNVEAGKVISTNPLAGQSVQEGTKVQMNVSKGAEKVTIPYLVGKTRQEANDAIAAAGLNVGNVTEDYSDDYDAGYVIYQNEESGAKVKKGTTVSYTISKGAETQKVEVPYLSNSTKDEAIQLLNNSGLTVGSITEEYNSSVTAGYVISQSSTPGSQVDEGTAISFVISLGSQQVEPDNPDTTGADQSQE